MDSNLDPRALAADVKNHRSGVTRPTSARYAEQPDTQTPQPSAVDELDPATLAAAVSRDPRRYHRNADARARVSQAEAAAHGQASGDNGDAA